MQVKVSLWCSIAYDFYFAIDYQWSTKLTNSDVMSLKHKIKKNLKKHEIQLQIR